MHRKTRFVERLKLTGIPNAIGFTGALKASAASIFITFLIICAGEKRNKMDAVSTFIKMHGKNVKYISYMYRKEMQSIFLKEYQKLKDARHIN